MSTSSNTKNAVKNKAEVKIKGRTLDTTSEAFLNGGGETVKLNWKPRQKNKLKMGSSNHTPEGCKNQPGLNKEKGTEQQWGDIGKFKTGFIIQMEISK